MPSAPPPPGPPIRLGTFLLSEPLGQGGMGTVWKARHPEQVDVAVKVLRPDYGGTLLEAFRGEVRSVASLDHPHVVRVFDYGVVPDATAVASGGAIPKGSPWLAMEYADGGTLGERAALPDFGALSGLVVDLLEGLAHAHPQGLVHRDLKPRNVLLFAADGRPRAALTDFGIAHLVGRVDPNAAQAGTPGYMAPEQIRGQRWALGPWTDLYALGCVIFRVSTGRAPFAGPSKLHVLRAHLSAALPRLRPSFAVPDGFEDFWRQLMAREPEDRYFSAADALSALRGLLGSAAVTPDWRPRHPATTERPRGTGLGIFLLRPWPLTGRDREAEATWELVLRARARNRAERVRFEGGKGLGKSRMLQWLARRVEEAGVGEAWRFPAGIPLRRRIRQLLRVEGLEPDEVGAVLGHWLRRRGSPDPAAEALALAAALRGEGRWTWPDLFARLAHDRVGVLLFDDLDRADSELRAFHDEVAALHLPLVLASGVGAKADSDDTTLVLGGRRFPLAPLAPEQTRRLVAFAGLSPALAEQVAARAAGNPWFVVRSVTEWARAGGLVPTTHGYDLRPGFDPAPPEDLLEVGRERVRALRAEIPGADAALTSLALLGGQSVREDEWRSVCARSGTPWSPARLQAAGLIRGTRAGRAVRFDLADPWLGEVLLAAATQDGRRRALHLVAAECLLAIPRVGAQERAIEHLAAAGDRDRAIEGLRTLIAESFHHDRPDRVASFLERERALLAEELAGDHDPRRVLHELDAVRLALSTGGRASTGTVLDRASRTRSPPIRARAAAIELQMVGAAAADPRWTECRRWFEEARDLRSWRLLLAWRVRWRSARGDVEGALEDARAASAEAAAAADRLDVERFEALENAVRVAHRRRDALDALRESRQRAIAGGHAARAGQWLAWESALLRSQGDLGRAAAAAELAQEELVAARVPATVALVQRGQIALARRAWAEAGDWFGRALAEEPVPPELAQLARSGLLVSAVDAEQWELCDQTAAQIAAALPATDDPGAYPSLDPDVAQSLDLAGGLAREKGQPARAADLWRLALRHHQARRDAAAEGRTRQRIGALAAERPGR